MDKRQRMTLLGIAAAIAAVAIAIALVSGGGDDKTDSTTATPATEAGQTDQQTTSADKPQASEPTTPAEPKPAVEKIRVEGGQPVDGLKKISVKKGEQIEIDVTSDTADEAHLHGYDIEKELAPGKTARFRFQADIEGVFELELHHAGSQLARITVKP